MSCKSQPADPFLADGNLIRRFPLHLPICLSTISLGGLFGLFTGSI
jgi:hypothetical protein